MTGINTEINLKMVESPDYCAPHYVQLYISNSSNERIPGCEIQIYAPNNELGNEKPNFCAWTNKEGRASFHLTQDVTYKIVTITLDGQKCTSTLTPNLDQYLITIPAGDIPAIPAMQTLISTNCTYKQINNTAAYINASYYDSSSLSSNLTFVLGTMSGGNTFLPLGIAGTDDSVSKPVGVVTDTFIVTNYSGKTYTVRISAQSQTYGTVYENVNVSLPDSNVPRAGSTYMSYFCILILIIAGLMFSKTRKAH
jgi:hypothetical protein